jgi:hypothetical protein
VAELVATLRKSRRRIAFPNLCRRGCNEKINGIFVYAGGAVLVRPLAAAAQEPGAVLSGRWRVVKSRNALMS